MHPYRRFWPAPCPHCPAHVRVCPPVLPRDETQEVGTTRRGGRGQHGGGGGSSRGRGPGATPRREGGQPGRQGGTTAGTRTPPSARIPPPPPARIPPPPPPVFGERRRGPRQQPPTTRPRGTATPVRCSGKARPQSWTQSCLHGTPPPPGRGAATPGMLRDVGTALHHATAQYRVPSVPRPPAAVPIPDGPSRAAAGSPQPPAHLGAADAPLEGGGATRRLPSASGSPM